MSKKIRIVLSILLGAVFLGSTIMMVSQKHNYENARETYGEAERISGIATEKESSESPIGADPIEENSLAERRPAVSIVEENKETWVPEPVEGDAVAEALLETDLDALREVNEDVVGWIMIPDTVINYPILQGEDNQYYLEHTWDGKENAVGSIFLECANNPDFNDFHTLVYGHNMKDKSMFTSVRNYSRQEYWESHPYVYLVTDAGVWRYEVYASYEAEVTGHTYAVGFSAEEHKREFISQGLDISVIDTGIVPEPTDRILTLSTCLGRGNQSRWVAQARLKMVLEKQ